MTFKELGFMPELLKAIAEKGYSTPTPIQNQAIPSVLEGNDLLVSSQTGTGKTACFTLPLLQNLMKKNRHKKRGTALSLILTPTRELAAQVEASVKTYSKYLPMKSSVVYGGVSIQQQRDRLRKGVDVLVATPGRLLDLVGQKAVDLSDVQILVLDEADRMLDMGFIHDIQKIIALLPKDRQSLMFSATLSHQIKKLTQGLLNAPKVIEVAGQKATADGIDQMIYTVDAQRKKELFIHLIKTGNWEKMLVFVRTKHGANRLAQQLEDQGISASAIHGDKTQAARMRALASFKKDEIRVLVATDVAARGLDIDQLPYVVNYDLPNSAEDYVHRIGRTGRAGKQGKAISLVSIDERKLLVSIERYLKFEIKKEFAEGFKPDPKIKAQPIPNGRFNRNTGKRPPDRNKKSFFKKRPRSLQK